MWVRVNGAEHEVTAVTLAEALEQLDYDDALVATALNGCFVPARRRGTTPIAEGDSIEVLAPKQGG